MTVPLWAIPVIFGVCAAAISLVESWWARRMREERRRGRRQLLAWIGQRETTRSPW